MRINRKGGRLRTDRERKEEVNPMDGLANLADVMLVFAAGLLMALIMNWNVDVNTNDRTQVVDEKYEVEGLDDSQRDKKVETKEEQDMEKMGTVYKDPKTGKYYVVEGN